MPDPVVLGIDSSTQSTKVEARALETGRIVATATVPHPPTTPPVSEHDPAMWWDALVRACRQLGDVRERVTAVAVAGQQHGLVLVDADGACLRPAKLWNDTTSAPQATRLTDALGAAEWALRTGTVPVPSISITKLAWVAEHEPAVLARTARLMLPHDYLTWRLTGRHVTDRGDASGTGWFDVAADVYRPELLTLAAPGWSGELPVVLGPTEPAGPLTGSAAAQLGLPRSTVVGPGTGDNMAAALGLGLGPGDVVMSLGTSGTVFAVSSTPSADPSGAVAGFASASGTFLPLVCTLNATKVTDAVAGWLAIDVSDLGALALSAADTAADAPVLLPYLAGERTPNLPDATGTLTGLTTATTRAQLALAAHDGVICGLLDGVDALAGAGTPTDGDLILIGGGSRSGAYRQRVADLADRATRVPHQIETVAAGAAVQSAAVASGSSLDAIAVSWGLRDGTEIQPTHDASRVRARYAEARQRV